jgi:hypothetical protein
LYPDGGGATFGIGFGANLSPDLGPFSAFVMGLLFTFTAFVYFISFPFQIFRGACSGSWCVITPKFGPRFTVAFFGFFGDENKLPAGGFFVAFVAFITSLLS